MQNILSKAQKIDIRGQELWLLAQKAIWWEARKMIFLSDLHLGKASHFRKSGIPVPVKIFKKDLNGLSQIVDKFSPETICFLGDLFHSEINNEFDLFERWMEGYPGLKKELVRGNHDILPAAWYKKAGIKVYPKAAIKEPFIFAHDPVDHNNTERYVFSGHIHPGVRLSGTGRQSLTLPCYYFGENQALLPAYGAFTGFTTIRPGKNDAVFVIGDGQVYKVKGKG